MADLTSQGVSDEPSVPNGIFSDEDIVHLLAPLKRFKSLLMAVSGGADSVALLAMVQHWRGLTANPPKVDVATVDHDLRPGSGDEVRWVAHQAQALGLAHHAKIWTGEKPTSGVQAAARSARYRLLLEICAEQSLPGPVAIVTAHTRDDQAETVVMRLARGSGIDGLGAMDTSRALKGEGSQALPPVMLVRPLLGVSKSRLVAFLKSNTQTWLEDPSNASRAFERVRLRQARPHLEALGLTSKALGLSAMRARRSRAALDKITSQFLDTHVACAGGAAGALDAETFLTQPDDLQIRILSRLLSVFGGAAPNAELSQIETVQARLAEKPQNLTVTLGGCVVSKRAHRLVTFRETGRAALPVIDLVPGVPRIWDQRFKVSIGRDTTEVESKGTDPKDGGRIRAIQVRALSGATFAAIRGGLSPEFAQLPAAAAQTLPSFWREDQLVAVPTLNFFADQTSEAVPGTDQKGATSGKSSKVSMGSVDEARLTEPQNGPQAGPQIGPASVHQSGHGVCTDMPQAVFIGLGGHNFGTLSQTDERNPADDLTARTEY